MKQNSGILLFVLFILIWGTAKQTSALDNQLARQQTAEADTAVGMADRVNAHRQAAGLFPYATNQALSLAAQQVADHMAATDFTSHYDGNGANPSQRALQTGYADHVTEIIYGGFGGSNAAWAWWTENQLHEGLLLSTDYHEFGVGMAVAADSGRLYWAIMFGTGLPAQETRTAVSPSVPGVITKLPGAAATAVPNPSPTASQTITESAIIEDTAVSLTSLESDALTPQTDPATLANDSTNAAATPAAQESEESAWLIIAAALTILVGVVFFYFPRARNTQSTPLNL
ncbi:MAG: hypothetical protein IPM39_05800 [Chloroflexi bacterium]|nr:hypothetical protein [Chloroflexota bacterium]